MRLRSGNVCDRQKKFRGFYVDKLGEVFKPQACTLAFWVTKVVGIDDLGSWGNGYMWHSHWVFEANVLNICGPQLGKKI